ncbi:hypothetical protein QJS04_geneDACA002019 [Acorus gramineus]|uniref:F-box domain-containing protein n=1 Tax=Acorus gramineus TaxID=55184 RepID=A0AAV9A7E6_ACOGR|nr:hypothetical protein QJS04_geneDACA002019 [Acorus gramineus]
MRRSAKKPRIRSRLFFRKPKPPQPQVPPPTTRPWSKLPLLFVGHLLRRLQVPDYIRFSSVCHAWHISKKRAQTPPAPQLPWLILPRQTHESIITYYSLSEDCKYRLSLPSIYGYDCIASIKGWLLFESVTVHTLRFLANPLSAERYVLPNLPDSDFTLPKVTAAAISIPSSPSEGGTRILIASGNVIVVWDLFSKVQTKTQLNFNVLEMVATANNVYIVMANLELVRYDLRTNEVTNIVQLDVPQGELPWPSSEKDHFLVVTEDWDVLMVVVVYCVGADDKAMGVDRLELYVPCDGVWVRMPPEVFGDLVLFLGFGGSSIGISIEKAGGRARTAYVVPKRERAKSLSNARRVDLKWVEINLESGEVSYK